MNLTYEGDVVLDIAVGSQLVELSPSSNPPVPFVVGRRYLIQITAASSNTTPNTKVAWRVTLVHT
jgi:hypothetical protein